jgi:hypothetical protein
LFVQVHLLLREADLGHCPVESITRLIEKMPHGIIEV